MQSQVVLLIFALNFSKILMHNNKFRKYQNENDNNDYINDTPSPEWIRYQQERFQHEAQQKPVNEKPYQEAKKQIKSTTNNERMIRPQETTARHEHNYQQTEPVEDEMDLKKEKESESINNRNAIEFPSIQGFIEFIKSIKQTWMKNSLLSIDDKIKVLKSLKDSLLKTIEKQFKILWQDDDDNENNDMNGDHELQITNTEARNMQHSKRSKRGILDESSINFPPEAALLSINFLTFSVFLIKLVLQVVNIIKSKHYQLSTINMDMNAVRNG